MDNAADAIMAVSFFGAIAVTVRSVTSIWGKRIDSGRSRSSADDVERRLARIETAVDAIALEVERIGETQRFTIRVATERDAGRIAGSRASSADSRAVTPH